MATPKRRLLLRQNS